MFRPQKLPHARRDTASITSTTFPPGKDHCNAGPIVPTGKTPKYNFMTERIFDL